MVSSIFRRALLPAFAAGFLIFSSGLSAHKRWLLPTDFALSDAETVMVDFTASNNLFYVDVPMPFKGVATVSPDGKTVLPLNPAMGARRSSFEVAIETPGTYRVVANTPPMYFVSYRLPGKAQPERGRGPLAMLKAKLPKAATEVEFAESNARIETYVTLGATTQPAAIDDSAGIALRLEVAGDGSFTPSHPNALYSDEPGQFVFMLHGKPAAGLDIAVVREGTRYRDGIEEKLYKTNARGEVTVPWSGPGRYLLEAQHIDVLDKSDGGELSQRFFSYFVTLEVLAP